MLIRLLTISSIFTFYLLSGCASNGPVIVGNNSYSQKEAFQHGQIRLECILGCAFEGGLHFADMEWYTHAGYWDDLSKMIMDIGYGSDLTYYYLGRVAEAAGYFPAAKTYYELSLAAKAKCDTVRKATCQGHTFPAELDNRINELNNRLKQKQPEIVSSIIPMSFEDGKTAYMKGDYSHAYAVWLPLATKGNGLAQNNLGVMYESGQGILFDYVEAIKWYTLAAEQGLARAQNNLGVLYQAGLGVVPDEIRALMWVYLSAAQGNPNGQKNRDIYEKQMTPEQIELAREMAQNCLTTHYKNCNFKPPISSKSRPSIKKIQKPVKKTVDKEVLTHESQIGELE